MAVYEEHSCFAGIDVLIVCVEMSSASLSLNKPYFNFYKYCIFRVSSYYGYGIDKMSEAKDLALKKASELKNQLEEEMVQKEKKQRRTNCELCGVEIDFKSSLTKFCAECSKNRIKDIIVLMNLKRE